MSKNKILIIFAVVLTMLALQVGAASAAPVSQAASITGTVKSITQSTDSSGNATFDVTILDSAGNTQTVTLSATDAQNLGLVTKNADGTFTINNVLGTTITVPGNTTPGTNPCDEKSKGFVAGLLSAFFCGGTTTVLDKSVDALHTDGFGYGEIAQACFMAEAINSTCGDILMAKQTKDYTALGLPGDVKNWGQLRKFALTQEVKSLTNLGAIVSGRATSPAINPTPGPTPVGPLMPADAGGNGQNGNGKGNGGPGGQGNGHGNGNGHGHKP